MVASGSVALEFSLDGHNGRLRAYCCQFITSPSCYPHSLDIEILCYFAAKSLDEFLDLQQVP